MVGYEHVEMRVMTTCPICLVQCVDSTIDFLSGRGEGGEMVQSSRQFIWSGDMLRTGNCDFNRPTDWEVSILLEAGR